MKAERANRCRRTSPRALISAVVPVGVEQSAHSAPELQTGLAAVLGQR